MLDRFLSSLFYVAVIVEGVSMPRYKKKITRLMEYDEFKERIDEVWTARDRAFLELLYFSGCRISEALAISAEDISCTEDIIFVQFYRLKGSKQTDPVGLPLTNNLRYLCYLEGDDRPFPFSRTTGWRLTKRIFPKLYPHYFRMNRITKISEELGDAQVYSFTGICAQSIDHYRAKVDIKKVTQSLVKELR